MDDRLELILKHRLALWRTTCSRVLLMLQRNQQAMQTHRTRTVGGVALFGLALVACTGVLSAQENPPSMPQPTPQMQPPQQDNNPHGWRRADEQAPAPQSPTAQNVPQNGPAPAPNAPPEPPYQSQPRDQYGAPVRGNGPMPMGPPPGQQQYGQQYGPQQAPMPPMAPPPAQLTIKPGTYITVRINQPLSSDHNQVGDAFAATLVRPVVVDGFVVAQRGQTIGGKVSEVEKAGRVKGTSKLGVQLTDLTLVDGQQVPLQTQLISRNGPTSVGRDAAAIGGTTALGAAAGAAADWGRGAAIGAGAGAFVGIVGVLLTRGAPTVLFPEQVLTFRVETPIAISTERSAAAFRYVEPEDYQMQTYQAGPRPRSAYGPYPYRPAPYGYPYYAAPYPYYWGPSFGFYYGPGFYRRWR